MSICEWCDKEYNPSDEQEEFELENCTLSYENINVPLCAKCALEAFEHEVEKVFFEDCEECGKRFDPIEDNGTFQNQHVWYNGIDLYDYWWNKEIICYDCALDKENEAV